MDIRDVADSAASVAERAPVDVYRKTIVQTLALALVLVFAAALTIYVTQVLRPGDRLPAAPRISVDVDLPGVAEDPADRLMVVTVRAENGPKADLPANLAPPRIRIQRFVRGEPVKNSLRRIATDRGDAPMIIAPGSVVEARSVYRDVAAGIYLVVADVAEGDTGATHVASAVVTLRDEAAGERADGSGGERDPRAGQDAAQDGRVQPADGPRERTQAGSDSVEAD